MEFSLIILTCNKFETTRRCLSAVIEKTNLAAAEIIVVDNGSSDGTVAWLRTLSGVRVIENSVNRGAATARNQAIEIARGKFIVFLDNDVEPLTENWLEKLREELLSAPDIAAVGAKMIYPDRAMIQCAGVGISRNGRVCFYGRGEPRQAADFSRSRDVQCLISACMIVRGETLRTFGVFDEIFNPVQFEDFDLCYRFREAGLRCRYCADVEMIHHESTTTQGGALNNAALVVRNGMKFKKRWAKLFANESGPDDSACRWRNL